MQEWVAGLIDRLGYAGVALLMFAENVFPPIPSELVMPLAGFTVQRDDRSIWLVIAAGTIGSLLGGLAWYWVGHRLGSRRLHRLAGRHGRWLTLAPEDIDSAQDWFGRHGVKAVLFGRVVPTVRTLISVPAGICGMPFGRFTAFSAVGTAVWTGALAFAGHALGQEYETVGRYLGPVSNGILGLIVLWYLVRLVRWPKRHGGTDARRAGPKRQPRS